MQDLISCLHEFEAYPFDISLPALRTLQSAIPASAELVKDFRSAHSKGEEKGTKFLQESKFSKATSIHATVSLSKRLAFANMTVLEKPKEDLKVETSEMEQNAL